MPRGKPPLPTQLKLVKGERRDRINDDEPMPEDAIPECPTDDPLVVEIWEYTIVQLRRMRVLTMADRDPLFSYCQAVAMHRRASAEIARDGIVLSIANMAMAPHPALRAQAQAQQVIKTIGGEFGMTPASRTRIKVADQRPEEKSQASRLLSS